MNNKKGFAISTMLYGLLIISVIVVFMFVSLANFNTKSNGDFVEEVEKELLTLKNNSIC